VTPGAAVRDYVHGSHSYEIGAPPAPPSEFWTY